MVIPFLEILFERHQLVSDPGPFSLSKQSVVNHFYFIISNIITKYGKENGLVFISCMVVVLFLFKNTFRYLALYVIAPVRNGIIRDLRNLIYQKITSLHLGYFSKEKKGDLIARMTNDVQEIEWSVLNSIESMISDPINITVFLITLLVISTQLTLFVFLLLPVAALLIGKVGQSLRRQSVKGQAKMGELLSLIEETLGGLRIIKAFNAIRFSNDRFGKLNNDMAAIATKMLHRKDLSSPMSELLGTGVMVTIMWFGGKLVLSGQTNLTAENFIGYIIIFSQLISPAKSFSTVYYHLQKGLASLERIDHILETENQIVEKPNAISKTSFDSSIEFRNVSFKYDTEYVLKNINLTIEKGKIIALVGPSGGGKSTFVDLIPRFIDTIEGDILVDGIPIKDLKINDLRFLLGIVSQESILFNDTVFNNIAFGLEGVSEEDVIQASKIAHAHEFISQMPEMYQANIGDRGVLMSGGQRQRLSIARAVLKNPPILILDEATSALDTESERFVQDALSNLMQNRTAVVIAHRLSTIQHVDEIIVLQKGEIVERGNHKQLLEAKGVYARLIAMQQF